MGIVSAIVTRPALTDCAVEGALEILFIIIIMTTDGRGWHSQRFSVENCRRLFCELISCDIADEFNPFTVVMALQNDQLKSEI